MQESQETSQKSEKFSNIVFSATLLFLLQNLASEAEDKKVRFALFRLINYTWEFSDEFLILVVF